MRGGGRLVRDSGSMELKQLLDLLALLEELQGHFVVGLSNLGLDGGEDRRRDFVGGSKCESRGCVERVVDESRVDADSSTVGNEGSCPVLSVPILRDHSFHVLDRVAEGWMLGGWGMHLRAIGRELASVLDDIVYEVGVLRELGELLGRESSRVVDVVGHCRGRFELRF